MYLLIYLVDNVLSAFYVPDTVLGSGVRAVNNTQSLAFFGNVFKKLTQ